MKEKNLGGRPTNPNTPPRNKGVYKMRRPSIVPPTSDELQKMIADVVGSKRKKFLMAYAYTGSITQAGDMAGCHYKSHYLWLRNEKYAKAFELVKDEAKHRLLAEAHRRAFEGSDRILIVLLQRYFPKFRECKNYSVNAHVKHAGELEVKHKTVELSVDELPIDMRRQMLELLQKKKALANGHSDEPCPPIPKLS